MWPLAHCGHWQHIGARCPRLHFVFSWTREKCFGEQKHVLEVVNVRQMVGRIVDADKGLLVTMFLAVGVRPAASALPPSGLRTQRCFQAALH